MIETASPDSMYSASHAFSLAPVIVAVFSIRLKFVYATPHIKCNFPQSNCKAFTEAHRFSGVMCAVLPSKCLYLFHK